MRKPLLGIIVLGAVLSSWIPLHAPALATATGAAEADDGSLTCTPPAEIPRPVEDPGAVAPAPEPVPVGNDTPGGGSGSSCPGTIVSTHCSGWSVTGCCSDGRGEESRTCSSWCLAPSGVYYYITETQTRCIAIQCGP